MSPVPAPPQARAVRLAAVPASVAANRAALRDSAIRPDYSGWGHFAFTTAGSIAFIAITASQLHAVRPIEWLTVPAALVFSNFAEYFGHRGPMHHPRRGLGALYQRHTRQHHRFYTHDAMAAESPRDFKLVLFPWWVMLLLLGGIAVPVALVLSLVFTANVGYLFAFAAAVYYLVYEWLHFCYHLPEHGWMGRLPFLATLRRSHTRHHNQALMTTWNFNITFPIADLVFGTFYRGHDVNVQRE